MNHSGRLEREDLVRSMRRQLGLARLLIPMMVRQQLREVGASPSSLLPDEALRRAQGVFDEMEAQIPRTVDDVFQQACPQTRSLFRLTARAQHTPMRLEIVL